jgi:hypothetical protein
MNGPQDTIRISFEFLHGEAGPEAISADCLRMHGSSIHVKYSQIMVGHICTGADTKIRSTLAHDHGLRNMLCALLVPCGTTLPATYYHSFMLIQR